MTTSLGGRLTSVKGRLNDGGSERDVPGQALLLVEPETVVRWHRAGYWVWILGKLSRSRRSG